MQRVGFILLSLFIIFMEVIITIVSIESGFLVAMFTSGLFLWIFIFVLGYFEMKIFFEMENRMWVDWIFFILCIPAILLTLILQKLGIVALEWASKYTPSSGSSSKSGKYKITTDSAGTEIIVDSDGNKVAGVDFVNWDGGVYGTDGKKYEKKGD